MGKLTLSVDQQLIEKAKAYSRSHGTSLSKLVGRFLSGLGSESPDPFFEKLHEELLAEGFEAPAAGEENIRNRHVREKYL